VRKGWALEADIYFLFAKSQPLRITVAAVLFVGQRCLGVPITWDVALRFAWLNPTIFFTHFLRLARDFSSVSGRGLERIPRKRSKD
jgi:hypothetical protein